MPNEAPAPLVVYVHGINQDQDAVTLKIDWDGWIFGREMGGQSRMAYWEDLVRDIAPRHPLPSIGAGGEIGAQGFDGGPPDIDAALLAAGVSPDDPEARGFAEDLAARLRGDGAGAFATRGAFDVVTKPLARWVIETFIRDTAAYFFKPGMRGQIRQRLIDQLPTDGTPVVIVAHSQGSIIAYEVLSRIAKIDLHAFITIGSPLGIDAIQDLLEPTPPAMPAAVRRWFNFAATLDPVAADPRLAGDYPPHDDAEPVHDESLEILRLNPHEARWYLTADAVRNLVKDELRVDRFSPFVLARDVAERLGDPAPERHSVLIEVLEPGVRGHYEAPEDVRAYEAEPVTLASRIEETAQLLRAQLVDPEAAAIDPLRRYVSARLTGAELRLLAQLYQDLRIYSVWRSSRKAKLTDRSMRVLKADAALASFAADGTDITWALLDTGIRGSHPHFTDAQGNSLVKEVWDCTKHGTPKRIDAAGARDPDGHGTHVAGIITGRAPSDCPSRQRGAALAARLVVYKVLDDRGQGEDAWIIKALDHIAQQNENAAGGLAIHGVNLSLGGPFDSTVYGCGFSPICMELRRLWRDGVLVVVACGNEGRLQVRTPKGETEISSPMSIGDPANLDDCIAVGSVNADQPHLYGISSFSSRGPTSDGRAKPDCVAPGERISSANSRYRGKRDLYYTESGTSMAAPHVSGLLAAFLSVRREYRGRPDEVKRLLLESCSDIGRDRYHQGAGVPNLMQMLLSA